MLKNKMEKAKSTMQLQTRDVPEPNRHPQVLLH